MTGKPHGKNNIELTVDLPVIPVLQQSYFKKDPIALKAIENIQKEFGEDQFDPRGSHNALMCIDYQPELQFLTLDTLIDGWNRL